MKTKLCRYCYKDLGSSTLAESRQRDHRFKSEQQERSQKKYTIYTSCGSCKELLNRMMLTDDSVLIRVIGQAKPNLHVNQRGER